MRKDGPYRSWDDDHTSLVHALWDEGINGKDADELASAILQSRWLAAVKHRASGGDMLCENGMPDGHSHVGTGPTSCLLSTRDTLRTGGR